MKPRQPQTARRWSWKLGELFGISIRVHVTLLVLLVWIVVSYVLSGANVGKAAVGALLVASVFAIIVLHELGHALVARRFGCRTKEILLLPIGGLASMEHMPERPRHELLVALAGPAVNVVLALVLGVLVGVTGGSFDPAQAASLSGALASQLLWINVMLAAFNLLPAFPMDGGRVFRAVLAMRLGRDRATRIASTLGKVIAAVFVLVGLTWNPMLALIGVFIWFAASQESASLALHSILAGAHVGDAMIRTLDVVEADEPIEVTADRMLADGHHALAVIENGRLAGVVTATELAAELARPSSHRTVAEVMRRDAPVLDPDDPLESTLETLQRSDVALVVEGGGLVGLLTLDQIGTYASFHARPKNPSEPIPEHVVAVA